MNQSTVVLEHWYAQPLHCPFCGEDVQPDSDVGCPHLLYVAAAGNFLFRSERFDDVLGHLIGSSEENGSEFSRGDIVRLGKPYVVANKVRSAFLTSVEFDVRTPTDSNFVAFAALDSELCGFGKNQSKPK